MISTFMVEQLFNFFNIIYFITTLTPDISWRPCPTTCDMHPPI